MSSKERRTQTPRIVHLRGAAPGREKQIPPVSREDISRKGKGKRDPSEAFGMTGLRKGEAGGAQRLPNFQLRPELVP